MPITVDTPIQFLKGVGPHFATLFQRRGIYTVKDLLENFPRGYEDRRAARNIASLSPGEVVSLRAQVVGVRSFQLGKTSKKMRDIILRDPTGVIHCKYFRIPFRGYFEKFQPGQSVRVVGKVLDYRGNIEFHHPDIAILSDSEEDSEEITDQLVPIYVDSEGVSPAKMRKTIQLALAELQASAEKSKSPIEDLIPAQILKTYQLPSKWDAFRSLHHPPKEAGIEFSEMKSLFHRRVIFEEFFWMELLLASRRAGTMKEDGFAIAAQADLVDGWIKQLPFELTGAQKKVFAQVLEDIKKPHPMNRLVQGDVGSGKTVIALLAAAAVASQGLQTAMMAPTEILAEQHFKNATGVFKSLGLRVELLVGSQTNKERERILEKLANGEVDLCVGTHALIEDEVKFKKLALAIVDEQHRFGVFQRQKLKQKSKREVPHFLLMTATPIPRTLAMTVFGDLDVSVVNEMPKGRQPIVTKVVYPNKREAVFQFMSDLVEKGQQAYVVYPLIEESEKLDLKNAMDEFEKLKNQWPKIRFELLHGRMKAEEKEMAMKRFKARETDVLVSTTVVEVGVDVPNSTMMIIEHAERFGLSQLHQLRGRVGRGSLKSYCVLMMGHAVSEDSRARMQIMASTQDGFKIAEADLEIRGPGEFLGSRQSGLPGFKMANLVRDVEILEIAKKAAFDLIESDPDLLRDSHQPIKSALKDRRTVALA